MSDPASTPATPFGPNKKPMTRGVKITRQPGAIISDKAASVAMATHLSVSGTNVGSIRFYYVNSLRFLFLAN